MYKLSCAAVIKANARRGGKEVADKTCLVVFFHHTTQQVKEAVYRSRRDKEESGVRGSSSRSALRFAHILPCGKPRIEANKAAPASR